MDESKKLTVRYLRELARKHVIPGYSRLRKDELIAALKKKVPDFLKDAVDVAQEVVAKAQGAVAKAQGAVAKVHGTVRRKTAAARAKVARRGEKASSEKQDSAPPKGRATAPPAKEREKVAPPREKAAKEKGAGEKSVKAKTQPQRGGRTGRAVQGRRQEGGEESSRRAAAEGLSRPEGVSEPRPSAPPTVPSLEEAPARTAPPASTEPSAAAFGPTEAPAPPPSMSAPPRPPPPPAPPEGNGGEPSPPERRWSRRRRPMPEARPVTEGFFVARIASAREEPKQATATPPAPPRVGWEDLGELPTAPEPAPHEEEAPVALARDPRTLFVFWSFGPRTLTEAASELDSPEPWIRVYDGDELVREERFDLQSRNFYLRDLPAGRTFRVELHLVAKDGSWRRLGRPSAQVTLPPEGPAAATQIRFMRVEPGTPLAQAEAEVSEELEAEAHFVSWDRIPLPGSAEGAGGGPEGRRRARRLVPPPGPGPADEGPPGLEERGWSPTPSGQGPALRPGAAPDRGWEPPTPSGRGRGGSSPPRRWDVPERGMGRSR